MSKGIRGRKRIGVNMLHIVLMILKIIGIVLAIVLGILLLCLCVVLFIPLRYKVDAAAKGDIDKLRIRGKFNWFFHILSGRFVFDEGVFVSEVKFLGRKLKLEEEQEHKTEEKQKEGIDSGNRTQKKKMNFLEKLKYTFSNICDRIKVLISTVGKMEEFLTDELHRVAWKRLRREFFRLLKAVKPKQLVINLLLGAEDPALTGKILAGLSMIYPFFPETINIIPDFTQRIFEGELSAKGKIRGVRILQVILNVVFDKNIRATFEDIEKLRAQN